MQKQSAILRILLHAFFLISVNLFSVAAAVLAIYLMKTDAGEMAQSGIALLINLMIYLLIYWLMRGIGAMIMQIDDFSMLAIILLSSLALFPAVFYPLHFLIKGAWSSFDDILSVWPFQFIVNGLCLVLNYFVLSKRK
jgi:hypothetical protein